MCSLFVRANVTQSIRRVDAEARSMLRECLVSLNCRCSRVTSESDFRFCAHQLSISKFHTTYMVCGICTVQFSYVEKTRKSESSSPDARPIIFHYLEKCLILIGYVMSSHASRSHERIARQTATRSPFRQDADQKSVIPQRGGVRLRFSFPLRRLRFANQRRKSY